MKKYVIIILISIFALSFNTDDTNLEIVNVDSSLISRENIYGSEKNIEQNIVLNTQNSWNDLMNQINTSNGFSKTKVNFLEYKVISVFDNSKGNEDQDLELSIYSDSGNIRVKIIDLIPEGELTTVITDPYHIIKIPTSNLSMIF